MIKLYIYLNMDPNIFVESYGAEYARSKLSMRPRRTLLIMIGFSPFDQTKFLNFSTNQLADLINFFCCRHIFEKINSSKYKRIAKMLNCSVDELNKTIKNWKPIDEQMLYDLLDFFSLTKGNAQHIVFLIDYVNFTSNRQITLLDDNFNVNYIVLKIFVGYFRNIHSYYNFPLSLHTKDIIQKIKYNHSLLKFAIFKVSENVLVQDVYNIIFNNLLMLHNI